MELRGDHTKAGKRLKEIRVRRQLSSRKVAELSRLVAAEQGHSDFAISHARLAQIENKGSVPSVFKLATLSTIYGIPINEILSNYIELAAMGRLHHSMNASSTHASVLDDLEEAGCQTVPFPVSFRSGISPDQTNLLSCMVEAWGDIPPALLGQLNLRKHRYGWIGLSDYTMYPLLRPGSFVQIEKCPTIRPSTHYRTEYDRPIYFVELRSAYLCSWCEVSKGRLISIPHPLSPCRARQFEIPGEAEIIGRVTGVAVRLANIDPTETAARRQESRRKAVSGHVADGNAAGPFSLGLQSREDRGATMLPAATEMFAEG